MAGKVSSEMAPEACCRPEQVLKIVANFFAGPKQDTAVMAGTPAAHIAAWGALRISWRDAVLGQLADTLAKNQVTADLGRRLGRYLEDARAIEGQEHDGWDGKRSLERFTEWTTERRRELKRKRVESALRPVKMKWLELTGHFHALTRPRSRTCAC